MRWIEWVEPYGDYGTLYCTVSEKTAIAVEKAIAAAAGKPGIYSTDDEALQDFMTVHWATFTTKPKGAQ